MRTLRRAGRKLIPGPVRDAAVRLRLRGHEVPGYEGWRARFDTLSDAARARVRERSAGSQISFSVVMSAAQGEGRWLARAIASVRAQLYPRWELCISVESAAADGLRSVLAAAATADGRIRTAASAAPGWEPAVSLASGDFVLPLRASDVLAEDALFALSTAAGEADLVYGDHDLIDDSGVLRDPAFKPDWNPDLLLSCDYIGAPCALRRSLLARAGGFRGSFGGREGYDVALRASAHTDRIRHLPFVLCHRGNERPGEDETAVRAVQDRVGAAAIAERGPLAGTVRLRWPIPDPSPLVSLIVPTRDASEILETCIESILTRTSYRNFELLVVDNQTRSPRALQYLASLERRGVARVLRFDTAFNFSAINNFAARQARGSVLGLLNNDLEVVEERWLEEMVAQALRPGIGAVGARLLYPDGTVQHGGVILGIAGAAGHAHKHAPAGSPGYCSRAQVVQNVSAVTAACLVVRKEWFDRAGGLDETLAVAYNDVDFCLRLGKLGLRKLWTPFATHLHHESRSRGPEGASRESRIRFREERRTLIERWGPLLEADPAYNPNLSLQSEDFALAWPPRVRKPWLDPRSQVGHGPRPMGGGAAG